jgi:hypothetical protein
MNRVCVCCDQVDEKHVLLLIYSTVRLFMLFLYRLTT